MIVYIIITVKSMHKVIEIIEIFNLKQLKHIKSNNSVSHHIVPVMLYIFTVPVMD